MYHIGFRIPIPNPHNQRIFVNGSLWSQTPANIGSRIKVVLKSNGFSYEGEVYHVGGTQKGPEAFPYTRY